MRPDARIRNLVLVLLIVALWLAGPAWLHSAGALPVSLYRGYVAGRTSGALLFSIVQAVGSDAASCHSNAPPAAKPSAT